MRWSDYLATLEPDAAAHLVNGFTLGSMHLVRAARLRLDGAPTLTVIAALAASFASLHATLKTLDPAAQSESPTAEIACFRVEDLDRERRDFLRNRDAEEIGRIYRLLSFAVGEVRDAGNASLSDASVNEIVAHLRRGMDALVSVRDAVLASSPDR